MEKFRPKLLNILIILLIIHFTHENLDANLNMHDDTKPPAKRKRVDFLLSNWGDAAKLMRNNNNNTKTESEIAAVFFGVAYGAPTPDPIQTTTRFSKTTTTTETTTKSSTTQNPNSFLRITDHKNEPFDNLSNKNVSKNVSVFPIPDYTGINTIPKSDISHIYDDEIIDNISFNSNSKIKERTQIWIKVVDQLGIAWSIHVHIFECLFFLVATVALVCLLSLWCLQNKSSNLLFFVMYGLIILIACVRNALLFLDPYGIYEYLPIMASSLLHNMISPIIVSVLALFLHFLKNTSCINLILLPKCALFGISIFITSGTIVLSIVIQLTNIKNILCIFESVIKGLIASWGAVLCLGFVVVLLKIEKSHIEDNYKNKRIKDGCNSNSYPLYAKKASRFGTAAGFSQLLISGLIVYSLVGPRDSPGSSYLLTWAWWLEHTLARLLEGILCLCVTIGALHISLRHQNYSKSPFIFPIFKMCYRSKASGVHPSKSNVREPLDIFTLHKGEHDSVDYVTSDFQLVWSQNRNQSLQRFSKYENRSTLRTENTLPRVMQNDFKRNATLPPKKYDSYRPYSGSQFYETIGEEYSTINKYKEKDTNNVVITNYKYFHDPRTSIKRTVDDYPTLSKSKVSNSCPTNSSFYWSPTISNSGKQTHFNPYSREANSLEQISEANTVSKSDVHVDYLTDISSSVDAISIGSEVVPVGSVGGRWHPAHTLPFRAFNNNQMQENKAITRDILSRSETNTPLLEQESNYNLS